MLHIIMLNACWTNNRQILLNGMIHYIPHLCVEEWHRNLNGVDYGEGRKAFLPGVFVFSEEKPPSIMDDRAFDMESCFCPL